MRQARRSMRERIRSGLIRTCSGQSVLEFTLLLPLLLLLVVNVVNFGGLLYAYIMTDHAARTGASYLIQGASSIYAPSLPSATAVHDLVIADMGSLPNASDATVTVCSDYSYGGSTRWPPTSTGATCTLPSNPPPGSTFADPQPSTDHLGTVQVQYTYCPFITTWSFPGLGIYTSLPSCTTAGGTTTGGVTVTRVGAMRLLQ